MAGPAKKPRFTVRMDNDADMEAVHSALEGGTPPEIPPLAIVEIVKENTIKLICVCHMFFIVICSIVSINYHV